MSKQKSTTLNCFSPPVMIATMIVEVGLALYTLWRYKMSIITRLALITLICLAAFQLAEYYVCTGIGSMAVPWSRVGFVVITALPPLALHMMHVLAGKRNRHLVYSAYAVMVLFMGSFLFSPGIFTGHVCTGNYVIFQFTANITGVYSVYYFGWLAAGIGLGAKWANELKAKGKKATRTAPDGPSAYPGLPGLHGAFGAGHGGQAGSPPRHTQRALRFRRLLRVDPGALHHAQGRADQAPDLDKVGSSVMLIADRALQRRVQTKR